MFGNSEKEQSNCIKNCCAIKLIMTCNKIFRSVLMRVLNILWNRDKFSLVHALKEDKDDNNNDNDNEEE